MFGNMVDIVEDKVKSKEKRSLLDPMVVIDLLGV